MENKFWKGGLQDGEGSYQSGDWRQSGERSEEERKDMKVPTKDIPILANATRKSMAKKTEQNPWMYYSCSSFLELVLLPSLLLMF